MLDVSCGIFLLGPFASGLSVGIVRLGSIMSFGILRCDFVVGICIFRSEYFVGIYPLGS